MEKIEVNVPLENSEFAVPAALKKQTLDKDTDKDKDDKEKSDKK
jgi:hypothetical protein